MKNHISTGVKCRRVSRQCDIVCSSHELFVEETHQVESIFLRQLHQDCDFIVLYTFLAMGLRAARDAYLEKHKVLWGLCNTVVGRRAFSDATLGCEAGPSCQFSSIHVGAGILSRVQRSVRGTE